MNKIIQVFSANGAEVIIFIDKITHMYSNTSGKTMIKLINQEGILTDMTLIEVLSLINDAQNS